MGRRRNLAGEHRREPLGRSTAACAGEQLASDGTTVNGNSKSEETPKSSPRCDAVVTIRLKISRKRGPREAHQMNQQYPPPGHYSQSGYPPPGFYGPPQGFYPPPVPPKKKHRARTVVFWVIGIFVALIVLANLGASTTPMPPAPAAVEAVPAPTEQAPTQQAPTGRYAAGVYEVGRDIQPGTYRTQNTNNELGYWARLSDTSGEFSAIIANGTVNGPGVVTIKSTDAAVEFSGNMVWTADSPS